MDSFDYSNASGCIAVGGLILPGMKFFTKSTKVGRGLGRMQVRLDELEKMLATAEDLDGSDHGSDDEETGVNPGAGARGTIVGGGDTAGAAAAATVSAELASVKAGGVAAGSFGAATGVGAAVLAPLAVIPAALTTPLWLGAFRVRSDIVIEVCKGVHLTDGKFHFTSGSFGSAFKFPKSCSKEATAAELTEFLEAQRKTCESSLTADFPTELSEGKTCLQFYNAWGSARGCCGVLSFRIQGTDQFTVFVVNNAFDRNLYNLSFGVCVSSCQVQSDAAQTHALFALCEARFADHGFAGLEFSTDVDAAVASASGRGFRVEGRMTSLRASTAWCKVTRSRAASAVLPRDLVKRCPRVATALNNGNLCAALLLSLEVSSTLNGHLPRGRLTYVNGGGGCARKMTVAYFDQTGIPQIMDNTGSQHTVVLPEGAHTILVKFRVTWGSTVKQIDRKHPLQPWVRASDGSYPDEVLTLENGDGVDAYFEVCGTSLHSYVHRAWDFGRDPRAKPREWEWWGPEVEGQAVAAAVASLPDASDGEVRSRLDALRAVLPAGLPEPV